MAVQFWQEIKHDQGHNEHGKQGYKTGDIAVAKFEHGHPKKRPFDIGCMQPNKACISEKIQDMDERNSEEQDTKAPSPINVENCNRSDEDDHRL